MSNVIRKMICVQDFVCLITAQICIHIYGCHSGVVTAHEVSIICYVPYTLSEVTSHKRSHTRHLSNTSQEFSHHARLHCFHFSCEMHVIFKSVVCQEMFKIISKRMSYDYYSSKCSLIKFLLYVCEHTYKDRLTK